MYQLIIADDEPKVRRRMISMIDWQTLGVALAFQAENGQQAFDAIRNQKIDIALIDINMPYVSGIELIEKIQVVSPETICIIVTGFDEFDYAQRSLQLGVIDYLLKPLQKDSINNAIEKAIQLKKKNEHLSQEVQQAREILKKSIGTLRQIFLHELIKGILSEEEINSQANLLEMKMKDEIALILMSFELASPSLLSFDENNFEMLNILVQDKLTSNLDKDSTAIFDRYGNLIILTANGDSPVIEERLIRLRADLFSASHREPIALDCFHISDLSKVCNHYNTWIDSIKSHSSQFTRQVAQYINKNFKDTSLNLTRVADEFHMSANHLGRLFRQNMGMTFTEYLIHQRICHAVSLLERTDLKISDIAQSAGYSSQHYFCNAFKGVLGLSPSEFRNREEKNDD